MALNGKILKYSGSQAPVGYVKFYGDATRGGGPKRQTMFLFQFDAL